MKKKLNITAQLGENAEQARARALTRPEVTSARTLQTIEANLDLQALVDTLTEQTRAVAGGELNRAEQMLAAQAHTLDAVFNHLARRALTSEYMEYLDTYMKLALRAQAQCRATWESVAAVKNPPAVYAKQANIAQGHQQVNYGVQENATRTVENQSSRTKLLEKTNGKRLDFGAASTPGKTDTPVETVGEKHRTKDAGG
jgi:hypothetical protein